MKRVLFSALVICLLIPVLLSGQNVPNAKLSKEKSGAIDQPTGKIAFIREDNLWVMNWNGTDQFKVVSAGNASGKLSWAPDGKSIAFCRHGLADLKGPDHLGGKHKVWDVFVGYLDSAIADSPNTNWWRRLTYDLGGRYPEWIRDQNKIIFTKDMNANFINALSPNYQVCFMDSTGANFELLRTDWEESERHMLMPTMGPDNKYAFVLMEGVNQTGVVISSFDIKTLNEESVKKMRIIPKATAPGWSPDGKWIAYLLKSMDDQGIYLTNGELTENYLIFKPGVGQTLQTFPISWSPDSKWLTFALGDGSIWIVDITGNNLRMIIGPGMNEAPAWSQH
ncbi:MAG: hypothetical protein GY865_14380 [candidate division Zixibacteria bacterium]|nr:hypothetical protein [candidate division Zixibacteria bacterium]